MEYVFNEIFPESYELLGRMISRYVKDNSPILDVGAGKGAVAKVIDQHRNGCQLVCLEPDTDAYKDLQTRQLERNQIVAHNTGLLEYLTSEKYVEPHYTIFHRSLHHMHITLDSLFSKITGTLIIGDPFFPTHVSSEEFEAEMKKLYEKSRHSHLRNDFHDPNLVVVSAINQGFNLQHFERLWETPKIKTYYQIVLEKKQGS